MLGQSAVVLSRLNHRWEELRNPWDQPAIHASSFIGFIGFNQSGQAFQTLLLSGLSAGRAILPLHR